MPTGSEPDGVLVLTFNRGDGAGCPCRSAGAENIDARRGCNSGDVDGRGTDGGEFLLQRKGAACQLRDTAAARLRDVGEGTLREDAGRRGRRVGEERGLRDIACDHSGRDSNGIERSVAVERVGGSARACEDQVIRFDAYAHRYEHRVPREVDEGHKAVESAGRVAEIGVGDDDSIFCGLSGRAYGIDGSDDGAVIIATAGRKDAESEGCLLLETGRRAWTAPSETGLTWIGLAGTDRSADP